MLLARSTRYCISTNLCDFMNYLLKQTKKLQTGKIINTVWLWNFFNFIIFHQYSLCGIYTPSSFSLRPKSL